MGVISLVSLSMNRSGLNSSASSPQTLARRRQEKSPMLISVFAGTNVPSGKMCL
ncbi:hypothetical protein PC116_g19264 [Phytophthora cactorum]|uniref:Uncharacterized protein n=1 Tax=Phytophthora cactorum TaxID=29920 RepID=A0A8T1CFZ9_9STRA|nr:hypothetical protein Pcac1_g8372 [Phytophthora cactorum]KAG2879032.1 hypothetical protein PC114_g22787 [Phytophthora cactorum]KAG2918738.1 hypothetical protein PC117_g16979 [Phytophthora cactorum]KAG3002765.1 hypothetical protein PC119_g16205 [Phytophthora cactorum]KAG4042146.1 hypothetical protein PC123_g22360 [Phytophthora cactorum]